MLRLEALRLDALRLDALDRAVLRPRVDARGLAALRLEPDEPLLERAELLLRVDAADRDRGRDALLDFDLFVLAISHL